MTTAQLGSIRVRSPADRIMVIDDYPIEPEPTLSEAPSEI
jgi:hypothetical protein